MASCVGAVNEGSIIFLGADLTIIKVVCCILMTVGFLMFVNYYVFNWVDRR